MKKTLLSIGIIAVLSASTALADKLSLDSLSRYLNELSTVQSQFTQINADGTLSTGKIYIKRPGRIRFEYDPPNNALVLASAGALAIFDPKGNETPESYPLSKTPLSLILGTSINLARDRMVVGHDYDGTATTLTVQDPDHPERGRLDLIFTGQTPELRQWIVHNESGEATIVILNDTQNGTRLGDQMFNIPLEIDRRKEQRK
jgi:outer membrane lipoprotein-sorting protein